MPLAAREAVTLGQEVPLEEPVPETVVTVPDSLVLLEVQEPSSFAR